MSAPDASWHRLSPRMLLVHPVVEVTRLLPVFVGFVFTGGGGRHGLVNGLVAAALVTVISLTRWFTTWLRITPEQVELRRGLVRRRTTATRRDRIRTVNVTSHLLHRVLGLARVEVGTGTSDRKGRDRLVLDGLTVAGAGAVRDELLHRGSALDSPGNPARSNSSDNPDVMARPAPGRATDDVPDPVTVTRELARLRLRWIGYAPFTLSGAVTGLLLWGFFWRLQGDGVDLLHSGPLRSVIAAVGRMPVGAAVVLVAVATIGFVVITSIAGYALAFWKFRLLRYESGTLEVTRGLFTTRSTSIERRRLVGVQLSAPLLLRAVGASRLLAVATGLRVGRGAERGGEVLLPPAPIGAVQQAGRAVLDDSPAVTSPLLEHGPAARRRRHFRAVAVALLLLAAALLGYATGGTIWPVLLALAWLAGSPVLARDRYRGLGHALTDGYLVAQAGSITRRRTVLASHSVIGWNVRRTFFQRRLGLATLTATTAAGRQGVGVVDLPIGEALRLAEAICPNLLTQFGVAPSNPSAYSAVRSS